MSTALWIFLVLAAVFIIFYIARMVDLMRQSKEAEKKIDYTKIRRWDDD